MAILGLLLLLAVAGLAVNVVWQNDLSISVDALGESFLISPGWLFVAGLAAGAIAALGLSLLLAGLTRTRRRRAALADTRNDRESLQAERDRLAVELQRERAARTSTPAGSRADNDLARDNDRSAEIDLGEERRSTPATAADSVDLRRTDEAERSQREPVGSGRHRLFTRRH